MVTTLSFKFAPVKYDHLYTTVKQSPTEPFPSSIKREKKMYQGKMIKD